MNKRTHSMSSFFNFYHAVALLAITVCSCGGGAGEKKAADTAIVKTDSPAVVMPAADTTHKDSVKAMFKTHDAVDSGKKDIKNPKPGGTLK